MLYSSITFLTSHHHSLTTQGEMKAILDLGVSPDRIIYANPCKQTSHLKFAARHKVHLMTFDNELELQKVKVHFPLASLVLRIRADDPSALCQLGVKFGTSVEEGKRLLGVAKRLGLSVVGVRCVCVCAFDQ